MVAGGPSPKPKATKAQVPTQKLVLGIVELYKIGDPRAKELAVDLAGCIIESYDDKDRMKRDIVGAYTSEKLIFKAMSMEMKRMYPDISKVLSEIFGAILFGEKI